MALRIVADIPYLSKRRVPVKEKAGSPSRTIFRGKRVARPRTAITVLLRSLIGKMRTNVVRRARKLTSPSFQSG